MDVIPIESDCYFVSVPKSLQKKKEISKLLSQVEQQSQKEK